MGNALPSIHSFFQVGCVLWGAPFLFLTKKMNQPNLAFDVSV